MRRFIEALCVLFLPAFVWAAPESGDYVTARSGYYVQDKVAESGKVLDYFLCVFAKAIPATMVNAEPYLALVQRGTCTADGNAQAVSVTSRRVSDQEPQVSKGHMLLNIAGSNAPIKVYFHLSATESPTASAPNGVFTLNLTGVANGTAVMRGRIVANATQLSMALTSQLAGVNEAYQLALNNPVSGKKTGAMRVTAKFDDGRPTAQSSIFFGEGQSYYCRESKTEQPIGTLVASWTECFDRSLDNVTPLSLIYGLYDDQGNRVSPAGEKIALRNESGTYGVAMYRAVQPLSFAHGSRVFSVVGGDPYTVFRAVGSLYRFDRVRRSMATIAGKSIEVVLDPKVPNDAVRMVWDATRSEFSIFARNVCMINSQKESECSWQSLPTLQALSAYELSKSISTAKKQIAAVIDGESLLIDVTDTSAPVVVREEIQAVGGTDAGQAYPGALLCLNDCPDVRGMATAREAAEVFVNGSYMQVVPKPSTMYQWDPRLRALVDATGQVVEGTSAAFQAMRMPTITSGRLVTEGSYQQAVAACDDPYGKGCDPVLVSDSIETWYQWQMTDDIEQRPAFLRKGDEFVDGFPAPAALTFKVPDSVSYGAYANASVTLHADATSGLFGIPQRCVSAVTLLDEPCGGATRSVPAFTLPEGDTGFVTRADGSKLWVRVLHREVLLAPVNPAAVGSDVTLTVSDAVLPPVPGAANAVDLHDPSDPASPVYAGAAPADGYYSHAPASVIDGMRVLSGSSKK